MARLGSFAAPVDLPEHLRPWHTAGIEALLIPGGLAAAELAPAPVSATPESAEPDRSAQALPGDHSSQPSATSASTPEAARAQWPEPWAGIAARVRTPPKIIITYASLTADVTGAADPARRRLFQSILAYMAWPHGTSLFWPCTDPRDAATPGLARNIFLSGVMDFGVTHIACFGPEAEALVTALFPAGEGRPDVQVVALPAPEKLLGLLPHELHRAVAALKGLALA